MQEQRIGLISSEEMGILNAIGRPCPGRIEQRRNK
jgi:hypothetical protein